MKLQFMFLTVLLCLSNILYGQNATITFLSDKNVTVSIYTPMDNADNWNVITDKIELKSHIRIIYELPVSDFCFVLCTYSDGNRYVLILQENDNLMVDYSKNQISCKGNNAEGIAFFGYTFTNSLMGFREAIDSLFNQHIYVKKNVAIIPEDIQKKVLSPTLSQINQLYLSGKITPAFKQILEKNFLYFVYGDASKIFNWLLMHDKEKHLNDQDAVFVTHYLDSLYSILPPFDESIIKYTYRDRYLSGYYNRMYSLLNKEERDNLVGKYGYDTFGPYAEYLLYPESFRSSRFGSAVITELSSDYGDLFGKIDKDKLVKYFEENYPNSQYLPVIRQKIEEIRKAEMAIKESSDSIIILEDSIVSLKELVFVKNLQGKYLYIDLWATWCIPCKQEFQYKGDLDQVLTQYPNIVPVYISMDNDELDQLWRKNINQYVLFGYHLRASKTLQNDILKQVYKGSQSFEIPRYILLNDSGTIVNDDLPRPRASDQLKEVLDGLM